MDRQSTAVRWESWRTRSGGLASPFGLSPVGGDTSDALTVELFIGGQWVDISDDVYYRTAISISRGRADEGKQTEPSVCSMTINNRDGRYSPRNPTGPYYGLIGRNTPLRMSRVVDGTRRFRFYGEVPSWPPRWDISGTDVYVPIDAAGILRRLGQGASPLKSTMYRAVTSNPVASKVVQYWPCEDASGAASIASAVPGARPMTFTGSPTLATSTVFVASDPLPEMNGAKFSGIVPAYTSGGETQVRMLLAVPAGGPASETLIFRVFCTGTAARWDVSLNNTSGGTFRIQVFGSDGTVLEDIAALASNVEGFFIRIGLMLTQTGADISWGLGWAEQEGQQGFIGFIFGPNTLVGQTTGRVASVQINPNGGLTDTVFGHVSVENDVTSQFDLAAPFAAYAGETAGRRVERLCGEEGIEFHAVGDLDDSVAMGAQSSNTLLSLLRECVDADLGILYESRDALALGYRTRTSLYNQDPRLALDYSAYELADSLDPVDDDQATRNDITVTRPKGSSARVVLETGALSVQPPPGGVGLYDEAISVNVEADADLIDQVGWRLHLGTVDESRYPKIALNLVHPSTFALDQTLRNGALVMDVGDRITIDNPPAWMPPDQITQIVQGYSEEMVNGVHDVTINCSPESPYQVGVADDDVLGRADTDGSTLAMDASATTTTLSVATTDPGSPLWTTDAADLPFDVSVGGEVVTVTTITGASSPQAFTVTRSVNGVAKPQTAGTDVRLTHPMILSL